MCTQASLLGKKEQETNNLFYATLCWQKNTEIIKLKKIAPLIEIEIINMYII